LIRAPFRLLSARAPRQAVLRASSRLASCFVETTTRPCDLPAYKTRDAFDRLLPPERLTCTRTSRVPGLRYGFRRMNTPRSLGLRAVDRGTGCFHDTRDRFGGLHSHALCLEFTLFGVDRAWALSSHGAGCNRASDTSVATSSSTECVGAPSRSGSVGGSHQGHRDHLLVKEEGS
jgi:hypothetical protein